MMHNLEYKDGLLYASITLMHDEKFVEVNDVIIDTGAFHTIILTDYLSDLGVELTDDDQLVNASGYGGVVYSSVRKKIHRIQLGDISLDNIRLDFGVIDPQERVNGLIGLDYLMAAGLVIDLVDLCIYPKGV